MLPALCPAAPCCRLAAVLGATARLSAGRALKITEFQSRAVPSLQLRLPRALSSLLLRISRDGAHTASLGSRLYNPVQSTLLKWGIRIVKASKQQAPSSQTTTHCSEQHLPITALSEVCLRLC